LELGYPELAVGDGHKALLLIRAGLFEYSDVGERVRLSVYELVFGGRVAVCGSGGKLTNVNAN